LNSKTKNKRGPTVERRDALAEANAAGRKTMDVKPFAEMLGLNPMAVYKLIKEEQIPAIRFPGCRRILIPIAVVEKILADPRALEEMKQATKAA
jgi:excisionase family DNA binding protein